MAAQTDTLEAIRIVGGVGTGKTEQLINRVAHLVSHDAAPAEILVLCASPLAASIFSARLREVLRDTAHRVCVTTPRAFALEVLSDADTIRFTGREPRLVTSLEEKFLLEDMKVSGLRPKRLREMLKFFYRSWTEMADDNADWLLPGEETETHSLLKANLAFVRSVMEPEAANLAVRSMRASKKVRAAHRVSHVIADDWQCFSRASQLLCELAATKSITVAGDADACVEAFDSYPYAAGLGEFVERHPQAKLVELTAGRRSQATTRIAARLLADLHPNTAPALNVDPAAEDGSVEAYGAPDPTEEFVQMVDIVREELKAETSASRIVVAVPNDTWARNSVAALEACGVHSEALPPAQPIRGDIRDTTRCQAARILTALDLVANPNNALAWRCWCGYGDYLVHSAAFAGLRTHAARTGIGLVEALERAVDNAGSSESDSTAGIVGAAQVADAYRAGRALIERVQGLTGRALVEELTRTIENDQTAVLPSLIAELCQGNNTDADAATMAHCARKRLLFPTLHNNNAVAVVLYNQMTGLTPDVVVVCGFVNGFIPCRDYFDATVTPPDKQEKMHAVDTRRVYALVGKAHRRLALTYFTSVDLETASKLKLKINRIKLKNGVRMCTIAPSDFLATLTNG